MKPQASVFTAAMSRAASSVSIVTTAGPAGRFGLTVSSMVSVSAEPPLLLVCINRSSVAHDAILANGRFTINVLAEHQHDIADSFAGRGKRPYDWSPGAWEYGDTGVPALRFAAAHFDCAIAETVSAGTHTIFIGCVLDAREGRQMPLLYGNRAYGAQRSLEWVTRYSN